MKTKLIIFMILALLMPIGYAYAWGGNDNSDRISNDQAGVFSPGYLNAAKQQAYSIVNQNNQPKSWWDNLVDKIKNKTARDVKEDASTKVTPEVKKKTSSVSSATSSTSTLTDSSGYNVTIGNGSSRLINGTMHYFVGFGGSSYSQSALQSAIDTASGAGGGIVILSAGEYSYTDTLYLKNGVRLYGGYSNDGTRNLTRNATIIRGSIDVDDGYLTSLTEINGFTFQDMQYAIYTNNSSNNLLISNNTIKNMSYYGILGERSNATIYNNDISTCSGYGIYGLNRSSFSILENKLHDNPGASITIFQSSAIIKNNKFWNNGTTTPSNLTHVLLFLSTAGTQVLNNTFYGGTDGVTGISVAGTTVKNNVFNGLSRTIVSGATSQSNNLVDASINPSSGIFTSSTGSGYSPTLTETSYAGSMSSALTPSITGPNVFSSDFHSNLSNMNMYGYYLLPSDSLAGASLYTRLNNSAAGSILKTFLSNKGVLQSSMNSPLNEAIIGRLVTAALTSAVGVPSLTSIEGRAGDIQVALALANILKNPTDDQKLILDAVESLLADIKDLEDKAGANPELNKAENDLLQMVATCLLAQGVPDLLKAGDIEGIKGIFKDLGQTKDKIMMDYSISIKPYYSNIVKELSTNLAMLQLKGILSKKITEEELRNLEPKEIDKILEAIRRSNDKSFEMEYLRQQDNKYRKEYLDPQNKALEEKMKLMLGGFTQKITKSLEDTR